MTSEPTWHNEPPTWSAAPGAALTLTTGAGTDFWRHTHYDFVRDSGHHRGTPVSGDFLATVRVRGAYRDQYDQAGLMVRLDEATWLKCGIELVGGVQWASAVVTRGFSDWSCVPLSDPPGELWLQVKRTGSTVEVSFGDPAAPQMLRLAHLTDLPVLVGPMAASPDGGGFQVTFLAFSIEAG